MEKHLARNSLDSIQIQAEIYKYNDSNIMEIIIVVRNDEAD